MRLVLGLLSFAISLGARPLEVDVSARSAVLMNADTGAVLFEKKAYDRGYPASTTKVATALYVLQREGNLARTTVVTADCLKVQPPKGDSPHPYWLESDGTVMGLKKGEVVSFDALLHGLMLVSGNDAANVLAETLSGSVSKFVEEMNGYLATIGCRGTKFQNPHGLTHPDHYSTAYDMAVITKEALKIQKFREIVSTLCYVKPKTNKQPSSELKLTNPFLKPKSKYYYSKAIGVKTGYTAAAQYPFVSAAVHEGRTLIAVVLGCEQSSHRFEDAKRLFETAFNEKKEKRRLIGPEHVFSKEMATTTVPLKASSPKGIAIEYFPSEEPECKAALHWDVKFPVKKGQKVGEIHISDNRGSLLQKGDLVAVQDVNESFFLILKARLMQLFH